MPNVHLSDLISGAIVLIIGSIIKLISVWRGDGNKRLETQVEEKKIDLQAEEQEAIQTQKTIDLLRDLLARADKRNEALEQKFSEEIQNLNKKVENLGKEANESTVRYAVIQAEYRFMESRVAALELQLQAAQSQNKEKSERIIFLEKELYITQLRVKELEGEKNLSHSVPLPPAHSELE